MGQRANLVIVAGPTTQLYYDHWCANRLDVELMWGPELALQFVRQREPVSADTHLLDDVWCEGGAVIDVGHRRVRWFGGEDVVYDIPRRRVLLELQRLAWPGWSVEWAHEGIVAIADALGVAHERVLTARDAAPEPFRHITEHPEDNALLLTREARGVVTRWHAVYDLKPLEAGPSCFPPPFARVDTPVVYDPSTLEGGVHYDADQQVLSYWSAPETPGLAERLRHSWPGTTVRPLGDRFEDHAARAPGVSFRHTHTRAEWARELLAHGRRVGQQPAGNHARATAALLRPHFGQVHIAPVTDEARENPMAAWERKLAVLQALENAVERWA